MGFLDTLASVATGGLGQAVLSAIEKYLPPDLSPAERENLRLATENIELQRARDVAAAQVAAETALNERIAALEGTASDLRGLPMLGPLMLFLRGAQRPCWGYGTLWIDYHVFSGSIQVTDPTLTSAFWTINALVAGFLFGERAVMNVLPLVQQMLAARKT